MVWPAVWAAVRTYAPWIVFPAAVTVGFHRVQPGGLAEGQVHALQGHRHRQEGTAQAGRTGQRTGVVEGEDVCAEVNI